jgi:hypothetical protein
MSINGAFLRKLSKKRIIERIFRERLSEPLHLNLLSLGVWLFGSVRQKIYFDLLIRHEHAFPILRAADTAAAAGKREVTVMEFGVANGAGLMNICRLCEAVTKETGVAFKVYGFDSGAGMPPPQDYRDHPELYAAGDFPMQDRDRLRAALPAFAELVIGDIDETIPAVLTKLSPESPLGFVSIDVDYYSSTISALKILDGTADQYLSTVTLYFDDIMFESHNSWCGERAAIQAFNAAHPLRKIEPFTMLRNYRLFKNAKWIDHIFTAHVLDHLGRTAKAPGSREPEVLENVYLS